MATLSKSDVEDIAMLARLELSPEEVLRLEVELSSILEHMDKLAELDTTGVPAMAHAMDKELRLRPDEVEPSFPTEVAIAQAPDSADDSFRVPNIIKSTAGD